MSATHRPAIRFLRFCAVGAASAGGALALFWALMSLAHLPYLEAFVATFIVTNLWSYLISRRAAFTGTRVPLRGGMARYFAIAAAMLVVNGAALRGLVAGLGWNPMAANVLLAAVNAPLNFLLHNRLTFGLSLLERDRLSPPR